MPKTKVLRYHLIVEHQPQRNGYALPWAPTNRLIVPRLTARSQQEMEQKMQKSLAFLTKNSTPSEDGWVYVGTWRWCLQRK